MAVWKARSASPVRRRVKDSNRDLGRARSRPAPHGRDAARARAGDRSRPVPGTPPAPPAQRILPEQRFHLGAGIGLGRRRLLGLLHEAVLVVLVDVEAAEAGRERAPRHGRARPGPHPTAPARPNRNRNPRGRRAPPRPAPAGSHTHTHTHRAAKNTTEPGKNPNDDFNVQIPSLQQVRGLNRDPEENGTNREWGTALGPLYWDPRNTRERLARCCAVNAARAAQGPPHTGH